MKRKAKPTGHWTKEPPKKDGWYWYRSDGEDKPCQVLCSPEDYLEEYATIGEFWSQRLEEPPI